MDDKTLKQKFCELYGDGEVRLFAAAGRVNLIGEHIDYCGGLVLPAALELRCTIAARKNCTKKWRLAATTTSLTAEFDLEKIGEYKDLKWGNYQAGVAYIMQNDGFDLTGLDLLYDCTVPFGSGLSSSAAIEVATAFMISAFSGESGGKTANLTEIAVYGKRAENEYCGVSCGIMDQFASSRGKSGNAILLDCATLKFDYVPLKLGDCELVIANSNKPHSLVASKYNERRSECESALAVLSPALGVRSLAEITPEMFETSGEKLLSGKVKDCARHVVYECDRVKRAVTALKTGDMPLFGKLLNESHYSLRDLYEVTGAELDALSDGARSSSGCLGSRMTGGGFGGCTISIVKTEAVEDFKKYVLEKYEKATGYKATCYEAEISDGITVQKL